MERNKKNNHEKDFTMDDSRHPYLRYKCTGTDKAFGCFPHKV